MTPRLVRILASSCAAGLLAASAARADDVTDALDQAAAAYKDNQFALAVQSLDTAAQLIRQKRADQFKDLLPEAPKGWSAEEATAQAAGALVFGGGVSAERRYTKDNTSLTVRFIAESAVLQSFQVYLSNPLIATADGGKLQVIKGQKAIVKNKDGSGSINIIVAGALLVQIEASQASDADLKLFAETLDYPKLAALL